MTGNSDLQEAMERCGEAIRRKWEADEEPDEGSYHRYLVEFECTYETYQEILMKIRSYPTARRTTRMLPPERG